MVLIYQLLEFVFSIAYFALIARVFLSWIPHDTHHPMIQLIHRITDPLLDPFKRFGQIGGMGIDFSPILAFLALGLIKRVVYTIIF